MYIKTQRRKICVSVCSKKHHNHYLYEVVRRGQAESGGDRSGTPHQSPKREPLVRGMAVG